MPNGMDYSLKNRVIDGTGMILDTEPGTPDDVGTYVTENQLADWIKGKILFTGYYHNGNFYSDSGHTTLLAKVNGALYIDQTNANKALYVCLSSTYQSLTEEAQVQAIIDGLNDGTIVPLKAKQDQNGNVIDQTYETKADASDLKDAIDANSNRISNLEQEHGGYVPVNYRGTNNVPTGKAKYGLVESIVGKSRAWNQLAKYDSIGTTNLTSTSISDNTITGTISGSDGSFYCNVNNSNSYNIVSGHVYLIAINAVLPSEVTKIRMYIANIATTNVAIDSTDITVNGTILYAIATASQTVTVNGFNVYSRASSAGASGKSVSLSKPILRDLTLIFGSGNEPSTVAEAVALCPSILDYDDFGYSLVDTTVEGVKSVGVNIWDEETEVGSLYFTDGTKNNTVTNALRSKNYIKVFPDTSYYLIDPTNARSLRFCYYSEDGTFISASSWVGGTGYLTITTPPSCTKMLMAIDSSYGATYNHDIQICDNSLSDAIKQTYHPYMTDTLSLSQSVTLRSAGTAHDELDVESGEVTREMGKTTISFSYNSGWGCWNGDCPSGMKLPTNNNAPVEDTILDGFVAVKASGYTSSSSSGTFAINTNGIIFINNGSSTTSPTGVLVYPLATPTTDPDPVPILDNTIQTEGGGTINTIQTQTQVIDNSMNVGYLAL